MSITIREHGFKRWFYRHVPGKYDENNLLVFNRATVREGLWENWRTFRTWCPLLTLTAPWFWRMVAKDRENGFRTCDCGRTWWQYRLLPAVVGSTRFGGGC